MSNTFSPWVSLAFCIKHAERMRHIVICVLSGSTKFSHIISKRSNFWKKLVKKVFFYFLYNFSWNFLILRTIEWDMTINVHWSSHKVPVFCPILMKVEFYRQIIKYQISQKFIHWERSCSKLFQVVPSCSKLFQVVPSCSKLFQADRQTNRLHQANSPFSQPPKHPNNYHCMGSTTWSSST